MRSTRSNRTSIAAALLLAGLAGLAVPSVVAGSAPASASAPAVEALSGAPTTSSAARRGSAEPAAAALLAEVAQAWNDEAAEALREMLAPGDIRFRLDPPGADAPPGGGDAPVYSAAQVFYMLQNHFAAVRTSAASLERRVASAATDQAHGVLDVQWMADTTAAVTHRRLFVGLRHLGNEWRIVEVRALP